MLRKLVGPRDKLVDHGEGLESRGERLSRGPGKPPGPADRPPKSAPLALERSDKPSEAWWVADWSELRSCSSVSTAPGPSDEDPTRVFDPRVAAQGTKGRGGFSRFQRNAS